MPQVWVYTLLSVFIVSLISLIGAVTLAVGHENLKKFLLYLVSFSAGALLGDVFIHILPEMAETSFGAREGLYILVGIVLFFILERFILWQHTHGEHSEEIHSAAYLTVFGDSLHNLLDGMIIAGSFLASTSVGIAVTTAVILHEIPQEIGNFAILIHGGWKKTKALWYNFLSALAAFVGAILVLLFSSQSQEAPVFLLCLGAASFIYIAMSDVIPFLHKEKDPKKSTLQLIWFVLGIAAMGLLILVE